jgi:hypothetical protein
VQQPSFTYAWTLAQRPAASQSVLSSLSTSSTGFTPDVPGAYQVVVVATDNAGFNSAPALLTINVACAPPGIDSTGLTVTQVVPAVTSAGGTGPLTITRSSAAVGPQPAQKLYVGVPASLSVGVTLGASVCGAPPVTYAWSIVSQPAGSVATLDNAAAQSPSYTPDVTGEYLFKLVLTDQNGSSTQTFANAADGKPAGEVGVCGTHGPTASANVTGPFAGPSDGTAAVEPVGQVVQLDASASTPGDSTLYPTGCGLSANVGYSWSISAAPAGSTATLGGASLVNPTLTPDEAGRYTVTVVVSDGTRAATTDVNIDASPELTTSAQAIYSASALDVSGNPVVAWWDGGAGVVRVARCTTGCTGVSPTWVTLPNVDTGVGPVAAKGEDVPRPIAIAIGAGGVSGLGNVYVAYFSGAGTTATGSGALPCSEVLAQWDGSAWSHVHFSGGATTCAANGTGSQPFDGRYVDAAIDAASGNPDFIVSENTGGASESLVFLGQNPDITAGTFASTAISPVGGLGGLSARLTASAGGGLDAISISTGSVTSALNIATCGAGCASPGGFTLGTIASGAAGQFSFPSIGLMPPGTSLNPGSSPKLVVLYRDSVARAAKLAVCTKSSATACGSGANWAVSAVSDGASTDFGTFANLSLDASGVPHAAWVNATTGDIDLFTLGSGLTFTKAGSLSLNGAPNLSLLNGLAWITTSQGAGSSFGLFVTAP